MQISIPIKMELLVWEEKWGLPSIDADSLYSLAYCKFCNVPVEYKHQNNNWKSPSTDYPVLTDGSTNEDGGKRIVTNLKGRGFDLDISLKPESQSDLFAYTVLVEKKLILALKQTFWIDTKNFLEVTRPSWASILPFPLYVYQPIRRRNAIISQMEQSDSLMRMSEQERNGKILAEAKECINMLSYKLDDKQYFFGDKPSSLDALVFAYLSPLIYVSVPSKSLQNHVKACPNLVEFCQKIMDKHFPESAEEIAVLKRKDAEKEKKKLKESMEHGEFPHKKRNILVAAGVVVVSMLIYAVAMGIVHFEFRYDRDIDVKTKNLTK